MRSQTLTTTVALTLLLALALPGTALAATDIAVAQSGLNFSPDRVTRPAGEVVTWHKDGGVHNVSSVDGMFRSGDPMSSAFDFSRTFSAGTFAYLCEVHPESMRGTVRVKPRIASKPAGSAFTVRWATADSNTGSRFRVQYRIGDGDWQTWKRGTTALKGVFGRGAEPIAVAPGTRYAFRVKSRSGDNASAYSPVRGHTAS